MYASIQNIVTHPVTIATMPVLKELMSNLIGKGKSNSEQIKEVEELKRQVELLTLEKETKNVQLLESKDKELKLTTRRNETLNREVMNLRRKLLDQQRAGNASADLAKKNEELTKKLDQQEKERITISALKEEMELEAQEIKRECEIQKRDNKELNDVVKLLSKMVSNNSGEGTSSSSGMSADEVLKKLNTLLSKAFIEDNSNNNKKKNKNKISSDNQQKNQKPHKNKAAGQTESSSSPHNRSPNAPIPGPSTSSDSHSNMSKIYPNMSQPYPNMGQPYPNMSQPHPNMGQPHPNFSQPHPNFSQPHPNFSQLHPNFSEPRPNFNQPYPNMTHPPNFEQTQMPNWVHPPNMPQNVHTPPLQMGSARAPLLPTPPPLMNMTAPNNWNQTNKSQFKPNIVSKPNNFGGRQNRKYSDQKEHSKHDKRNDKPKNENDGKNDGKKIKSDSSKDLWAQLDKLKVKIKENKTSRHTLCHEVSTMITDATEATVTSKDKLIKELSECLQLINKLPDEGSAGTSGLYHRRNFKPDSRRNYKNLGGASNKNISNEAGSVNQDSKPQRIFYNRGLTGYVRYHWNKEEIHHHGSQIELNYNSDENNSDDASSLCSEPAYNRSRGGRGRGRGGFHHRRFHYHRKDQSADNKNEKSQQQNEHSDDNNCSDGDGASSVSSEKDFRGRGRGKWRGNWRGRDNFRRHNHSRVSGSNATSSEKINLTNDVDEIAVQVVVNTSTTDPPPQLKKKKKNRSKKGNNSKESQSQPEETSDNYCEDLMVFDDEEKSCYTVEPGYASEEVLELFIGEDIPSLMDTILNKIDVTLKVKGCTLVATKNGNVVNEKPTSLLDIIQFKQNYPDAVCFLG